MVMENNIQTGNSKLLINADEEWSSALTAPEGWEITDDRIEAIPDVADKAEIRKAAGTHLPFIAHKVELYIDRAGNSLDIFIPEAFISIDDDYTFHIELLVKQDDLHAPKFMAAKLLATQILSTTGNVSMRYTFAEDREYSRFHTIQPTYKLKYAYKPPFKLTGMQTAA